MEFKEAVEGRRSIRKYTEEKIPHETLREIVRLASCAPSWKNTQTVSYVIVEDETLKAQIAADVAEMYEYNGKVIASAPALAVLITRTGISGYEKDGSFTTSKEDRWEVFDAGIAAQTFCLAAFEEGVGTVIMGIFDEEKTAQVLGLEEDQKAAVLIAMGYAAKMPDARPRKSVDELLEIR